MITEGTDRICHWLFGKYRSCGITARTGGTGLTGSKGRTRLTGNMVRDELYVINGWFGIIGSSVQDATQDLLGPGSEQ